MPTITPQMSAEEYQVLFAFLTEQTKDPKNVEWYANHTYTIKRNGGETYFQLNYNIVSRGRNKIKPGLPCDILAQEPFSRGTFGQVFNASSLVIHPDSLTLKDKNLLVKKIELYKENYLPKHLKCESHIMAKIDNLHSKPPTMSSDKKIAYMAMRKLPGIELSVLVENEDKRKLKVSMQHRFSLCLEILQVVKTQFADKGIVHGDISNSNILVLFEKDHFKVSIIDCGKSFDININSTEPIDSPGKRSVHPVQALSALEGSSKIDIYRLGKLFHELWPLDLYPFLPDDIQDELTRVIKKMSDEGLSRTEYPQISLQEVIDSFSYMLAAITDPLEAYKTNKDFFQPFDLEEITHKPPSLNPDSIAQQQSPFSKRLSLFSFITTDRPSRLLDAKRKPFMPETHVEGLHGSVPLLQLPFFSPLEVEKKTPSKEMKLLDSSQIHRNYLSTLK